MDETLEVDERDDLSTSDIPKGQFWQSPATTISSYSSYSDSPTPTSVSPVSTFSPQSFSKLGLGNPDGLEKANVQAQEQPENRRQARLLLVSLLENVCALYPAEQSRAVFTTLCERLSRMGIITGEDFADDFSSIRTLYKRALNELIRQARFAVNHSPDALPCVPNTYLDNPTSLETFLDVRSTRYRTDFHEIRRLGKGGFGSVWHVRHKLDGEDYAVKKIRVKLNHQIQKKLREVRVLAGLNHPNIVRYFSAWLEFDEITLSEFVSGESTSYSMDHEMPKLLPPAQTCASNSQKSHASNDGPRVHDSSKEFDEPTAKELKVGTRPVDFATYRPLTLFIQMELCSSTLYEYLVYRNTHYGHGNAFDFTKECAYLFRSLLLAVAYIHEKGLSHRDITPHNVFLVKKKGSMTGASTRKKKLLLTESISSDFQPMCEWMDTLQLSDIQVKLGDFGLATEFASSPTSSLPIDVLPASEPILASPSLALVPVTTGVGTTTYSAPEQLRPTPEYDVVPFQSDMYSLGIVLFELLHPFGTIMERMHLLQQLRKGYLPPHFIQQFPHHAAIILWLTAENPMHRPTPQELLEMFPKIASPSPHESLVHHLKSVVESQDRQLKEQAAELEKLRAQLEALQSKKEGPE